MGKISRATVLLAFIAGLPAAVVLGQTGTAMSAHPSCTTVGTAGNDTLIGTSGPDFICGEGGDDVIFGSLGDDVIDGGPGADQVDGGPGSDRIYYGNHTAGVTVTLAGGADDGNASDDNGSRRDRVDANVEQVSGTVYDDVLIGADGVTNVLSGSLGDDTVSGWVGLTS